jgi:hypothetical protein
MNSTTTPGGTFLALDECAPHPVGDRAPWDLDALPDDPHGRVIIRLASDADVTRALASTDWYRTTDLRTGYTIEIRHTDCGQHRCTCAQVRVI